ncbi:hypothetical protein BGX28_005016 [Mortierella sp. GBA30]|nr:hypothetical protein BGX28_005016 [Mortierella sp. GBA30]
MQKAPSKLVALEGNVRVGVMGEMTVGMLTIGTVAVKVGTKGAVVETFPVADGTGAEVEIEASKEEGLGEGEIEGNAEAETLTLTDGDSIV